jgi:hypothetical protein
MRPSRICLSLSCCFFALTVLATGQSRKPGLWETTTVQTWQQSPLPPGMAAPANSPFAGGPHTSRVCITQAQIDRDEAFLPQSRRGCQATNIVKRGNGMSADWVCTGAMSGKGTVESTWYEDGHSKSKVHFVGNFQTGANPAPVEFTSESTSIYKGPDCGNVKPFSMPAN